LLYSIFARIGGSGLDTDAFETLRASHRGGFLGRAIAYDNRQTEIPARLIYSLRWHPVRLISFLDRPYYYGAKRSTSIGSRRDTSPLDVTIFSTVGRGLPAIIARRQETRVPSIVEIPTWHRDRGKVGDRAPSSTTNPSRNWKENLLQTRERFIEEYDLADVLFVLSQKAADTFRVQGFSGRQTLLSTPRVDIERFKPGPRPPIFRAVFSGALIERKGIHHLLEAWHRLDLKDAELWLVGAVHDEAKPHLKKFWRDNIKVVGFKARRGKLFEPGNGARFPIAMRRKREGGLRGGGVRAAANHDARGR